MFRSQIEGGKDSLQATVGRRGTNATFLCSHAIDEAPGSLFAMDRGPLLDEGAPSWAEFLARRIEGFWDGAANAAKRIRRLSAPSG